jgi:hypothetical protein
MAFTNKIAHLGYQTVEKVFKFSAASSVAAKCVGLLILPYLASDLCVAEVPADITTDGSTLASLARYFGSGWRFLYA